MPYCIKCGLRAPWPAGHRRHGDRDRLRDDRPALHGSILLTLPIVRGVLEDYDRQRECGIDPHFDPRPLGIEGATFRAEVDPATLTGSGAVVEGEQEK